LAGVNTSPLLKSKAEKGDAFTPAHAFVTGDKDRQRIFGYSYIYNNF
jgi:hypothetical protein